MAPCCRRRRKDGSRSSTPGSSGRPPAKNWTRRAPRSRASSGAAAIGPAGSAAAASAHRRPPSPRDIAHLRALYDGDINYTDDRIGRLLDALKSLGIDRRTAVVVTADHGEGFFEHGRMRHGNSFYDELMRVPLIMRLPG